MRPRSLTHAFCEAAAMSDARGYTVVELLEFHPDTAMHRELCQGCCR
jgi:hypothetical protein